MFYGLILLQVCFVRYLLVYHDLFRLGHEGLKGTPTIKGTPMSKGFVD